MTKRGCAGTKRPIIYNNSAYEQYAAATLQSEQKNALNSIFDKTKDVLSSAAETTKGYASQAQHAIGRIIPGASQETDTAAAAAAAAPGQASVTTNPTAATTMQ